MSQITSSDGNYVITDDISGGTTGTTEFTGTLTARAKADGTFPVISGIENPLFETATNATISNIMLKSVSIKQNGYVGAIACTAKGTTRIYNCGILPTTAKHEATGRSTVESTNNDCGSLVGCLDGYARVINCFSYANVKAPAGNNKIAGGLVGRNTTGTKQVNSETDFNNYCKTMVVNCMFYGDITQGNIKRPVYGGTVIANNAEHTVNNYNYFCEEEVSFEASLDKPTKYFNTWPVAKKYLTRFDVYRNILNSNRRLCTWWVNGAYNTAPTDANVETVGIAKWVLDLSIAPYPILKKWGEYPSVINQDPVKRVNPSTKVWENRGDASAHWGKNMAPDTDGQKLGSIEVSIDAGSHHTGSDSRTINITAMDTEYKDYCYGKIQLPYYNEIFGNPNGSTWSAKYGDNYGEYVVTGWEITSTNGSDADGHSFSADWQDGYNFADRKCVSKDLYETSGRVFAQGGYYYVPEGVTTITIKAHWGKAVYLCNKNYRLDMVNYASHEFYNAGALSFGGTSGILPLWPSGNTLKTSLDDAIDGLSVNPTGSVYDQAIVLVGNYQNNDIQGGANNTSKLILSGNQYDTKAKPFTIMSADFDFDNEPDFCFQVGMKDGGRPNIHPIRFDFLMVPDITMAIRKHETNNSTLNYLGMRIICPQGHFEVTETSYMYITQFEYDKRGNTTHSKHEAPLILNGGEFMQIVSTENQDNTRVDKTSYFLMGGNLFMKAFTPGTHGNRTTKTRHCAVNAIGGEFEEFYLSGMFRSDVYNETDNPHAYLDGGKFGIVAGAGMESVGAQNETNGGNVTFKINHSWIREFYGGGINASKPVTGNIEVTIDNSIVHKYCGGPKLGNMSNTKTIKTYATGTTFDEFYGGGNGGTNLLRDRQYDAGAGIAAPTQNDHSHWDTTAKFNAFTPFSYTNGKGYQAEYEFEMLPRTSGNANVITRSYYYWASFSKTIVAPVTNTITDCTFNGNFYGGGNLGAVDSPTSSTDPAISSTLSGHTVVHGSVFGAGFSASATSFKVHDKSTVVYPYRDNSGFIHDGSLDYEKISEEPLVYKEYTWIHDIPAEWDISPAPSTDNPTFTYGGKTYCYTPVSLDGLGMVTGDVTINIEGNTRVYGKVFDANGNEIAEDLDRGGVFGGGNASDVTGSTSVKMTGGTVEGSVYGGANLAKVNGSTTVTVSGGTVGKANAPKYEALVGNIYGGGKGKNDDKMAGLVTGSTTITISGTAESPFIYHNVYGGGAYGSVGEFNYDTNTGMPTGRKEGTTGGTCVVNITGGTIGTTGQSNGMVFGSSRGDVATPGTDGIDPNDRLAWVYDTNVTIGTQSETPILTTPLIRGSVYGSGENGHTFHDTDVKVHSGTIGIKEGAEIELNGIKYEGPRYLYRGNVYGGGCGTDTYETTIEEGNQTKIKTYYNFNAGIVKGNTNVVVDGGHIVHNVYGGGAMGSVGTYAFADAAYIAQEGHSKVPLGKPVECANGTGTCKVTISGGKIGVSGMQMTAGGGPDDYGHVFGAGRGDAKSPDDYPNVETSAYYNESDVTITGSALVMGSVYGGSESGHVLGNTKVTVEGGQIGCGEGMTGAYAEEDWEAESPTTLKPTSHWTYVDDGAPYDMFADENGNYVNNVSSEGGNRKATDGHTFYGNVFGGGSGYYPYAQGKWLFSSGRVEGNAEVVITGGHILNNVYGGCEMSDVIGDVSINMSGGTVGVPRTAGDILLNPCFGHIFGAGMGDKRIFFNQVTNVQNSTVSVSGGRVYGSVHGGGEDGHVLKKATTTISKETGEGKKAPVIGCDGTSGYDGNVFGGGQGSPTALTAGTVGGNVELNILEGTMHGSVYGGGRIASVGTFFELVKIPDPDDPTKEIDNPKYGKMQEGTDHGYITVNLKGGTIDQNVYGGCMGTRGMAAVDQVRFAVSKNVTVELNKDVEDNERGCAVKGSIFGCNNVNSSPQEDVTVHVYKTQNALASRIAGAVEGEGAVQPKVKGRYDIKAVYGGGNMAAYLPKGPNATNENYDGKNTTFSTKVIIDGCDRTSIQQVYGGGNAASTPATEVTINGTYEIDELFGGGNGKDKISYVVGTPLDNPGANVGFYDYSAEESTYDTKEKRTEGKSGETFASKYVYGTGKASVNIFGGTIHYVFGGSNTKGNVRETALTLLEEGVTCPFCVDEVYGGGKSAEMDAEAKLLMACIPGLKEVYGGAEAADVHGNVTLNITNGTFDRVFGGNNLSGTINGSITINIEEVGCKPIVIGELYGGGNQAGYSVYGYDSNNQPIESGSTPLYNNPQVNVKSFTSIGSVYGGGYGSTATMVGNPTVNINVAMGDKASVSAAEIGKDGENNWKDMAVKDGKVVEKSTEGSYPIPYHKSGKIGAIGQVFGGGNAAPVKGDTQVNIGTQAKVPIRNYVAKDVTVGTTSVEGLYTRSGEGTEASPYKYTAATGIAVANTTYYEEKNVDTDVKGVDIRGNVYGGGNNAEVTGNTNVTIGK